MNASVVLSPAGLATEADLAPLRDKVEAKTVPSRTVEVAAAELASYIASLPRLLAENLTVEIKAGTVPGQLTIQRFCGPGSLKIKEKAGGTVSFTGNVEIGFCDVPVYLEGLTIRNTSGWGSVSYTDSEVRTEDGAVYGPFAEDCELSSLEDCSETLRSDWRAAHPNAERRVEELEALVAELLFGGGDGT